MKKQRKQIKEFNHQGMNYEWYGSGSGKYDRWVTLIWFGLIALLLYLSWPSLVYYNNLYHFIPHG